MILVTVGTHETPFDRLLRAVSPLAELDELVVQHGSSSVRPEGATLRDFCSFPDLTALVERARVVVTHAGAGSVLLALAAGKRPVVVPRLARFGEAVDDHQLVFARHLAGKGTVTIVEDLDQLVSAVGNAGEAAEVRSGAAALTQDLSSYLRQTLAAV